MKLQIERPYADAMLEAFPTLTPLKEQLRFGNRVEVAFSQLTHTELAFLQNLYQQAGPGMNGRAAQIATLQKAMNDEGPRFGVDDLEKLLPAIAEYLVTNAQRGWLFKANASAKPIAYVITRLDYTPPGEEEAGRILLEIKANSRGKIAVENLIIRSKDIVDRTVSEIFAHKGFLKETPELIQAYDESAERYFAWRAEYGKQFSARGTGVYAEDPTATHRNTDWSRKNVVVLTSGDSDARLVNDESILEDRVLGFEGSGEILNAYLRKAGKSARYDVKVEDQVEASRDAIPKGLFTELPVHGYILMFHLELHHHLWVHVDDMRPYLYQPELKQKLILPPEQTDLIDILTAEMDVLMDDIVAGKSGGTTVLCAGPAGVGKTLTAEVYSEIIQRPLYRVHSGQLGLSVSEMEKALKDTLTRAQRWGAVMLIDEADVYIKRRDDNIAANAVVGVFLRVLEYFNGLLFLTTNRVDDIDEAIISRCIAMIKYHPPHAADRRAIWQVMTQQFALDIDAPLLEELVTLFPEATGRDIKGLTKLVAKFCQHKSVAPDLDVFKRCSIFRGMELQQSELQD
jgi:hypothetical protein